MDIGTRVQISTLDGPVEGTVQWFDPDYGVYVKYDDGIGGIMLDPSQVTVIEPDPLLTADESALLFQAIEEYENILQLNETDDDPTVQTDAIETLSELSKLREKLASLGIR